MLEKINKILETEKSTLDIHRELLDMGVKVTRKALMLELKAGADLSGVIGRMKVWKRKEK